MNKIPASAGHCTISDDWTYKEMRVVYMENEYLKVGILVDRGSDIFEFYYKPAAIDFMLRLDKGIRNPNRDFSQMRDTGNQFEDYYYGGWQEVLPNSPSFNYRGASLGQHGEIALIPWKHAIVENTPGKVSLKLWVRPLRLPVLLEKTLTITSGSAHLKVDERLVNESQTTLDVMWGHHIAFGLPFLTEGAQVITNAKTFMAEPNMPEHRRFKAGETGQWPEAKGKDGKVLDASRIPPSNQEPYSELAYMSGYAKEAYYTLWSRSKQLGFTVSWDASVFSTLWYWQERYATQDAPWWGNAYAVGLEPWTSKFTGEPESAIKQGQWLKLHPGEEKHASLQAGIVTKII